MRGRTLAYLKKEIKPGAYLACLQKGDTSEEFGFLFLINLTDSLVMAFLIRTHWKGGVAG